MELSLSRVHFPVTTLGPDGAWASGSRAVASAAPAASPPIPGGRAGGASPWHACSPTSSHGWSRPRGITVSGGEPFEQFAALLALLGELRQRSRADILVYSGYPLEHLHAQLEQAAGLIDALISDPYQQHAEQSLALRGSDNQRLSLLTDLGRARLGGYQRPLREDDKALDLMFDHDGSVWMAGIPRRDDLLRLQDLLREQGHQLSVSAHRPR